MKKAGLIVGVMLLVGCGCGSKTIGPDWKRIEPGVLAEDFTLPQLGGGSVKLSDLRGRIVIMECWATWCGPCRFSLPSLELIYRRYRDRGVTVLLLNQGEKANQIQRWAEKRFTAPILLDATGSVAARYKVDGIPRLFIVGQDGQLVYEHAGYGGGLEHNLTLILDGMLQGHRSQAVSKG